MDTDVLVVGAGPTGLMLANQLARCGVRPDGHVGLAGTRLDIGAATRYVSGRLHFGTKRA
jgi:ribulose 1,5-bisphosphate synthetase/thiazole synthase